MALLRSVRASRPLVNSIVVVRSGTDKLSHRSDASAILSLLSTTLLPSSLIASPLRPSFVNAATARSSGVRWRKLMFMRAVAVPPACTSANDLPASMLSSC